jgi:hypothetical protein
MAVRGAMVIKAVAVRLQTAAARLARWPGRHDRRARPARQDRVGQCQAGKRDAGDAGRPGGLPSCSAPFFLSTWRRVGVVRREHAGPGLAARCPFSCATAL